MMSERLSANTQAILLLAAPLMVGKGQASTSADLLEPSEYQRLAAHLVGIGKQPADLLSPAADEVIAACDAVLESERLRSLLGRGFLLSQAVERWQTRAIWVVSRADATYPKILKTKPEEAPALVDRHLHVPYAYNALREDLRGAAIKAVTDYLQTNDLRNVELSEKVIELNLGNGVRVNGRIDLVRRIDTGATTIVDLKSTRRAQDEDLSDDQLHIYALGYRELTGRDADYVEIYNLDVGKGDPLPVDDEIIAEVKERVHGAARALRENDFPARPTIKLCEKCDYLSMCSQGQAKLARRGA